VVANARKSAVGKDILDFAVHKTQELLQQGDLTKAKLMLRFLAGLARIIDEDGILHIVREIVSNVEGKAPNVHYYNFREGLIGRPERTHWQI